MKYFLLLTSMMLATTGQFSFKRGVSGIMLEPTIISIFTALSRPLVVLGFILYLTSAVIWLFVLQRFPLSVAYPALATTYVIIVVASAVFLHEPITAGKIVGVSFILLGVFLLFQ